MTRGNVIVVEGIIGAGKSSFSKELAEQLGSQTLYLKEPDEENDANPYLASFYSVPSRWAYTMQTHLLQARYKMHQNAQWHAMTTGASAVLDRSYFGDTAFAKLQLEMGDMSQDEFNTYRGIYHAMTSTLTLPDFCIHLNVSPEVSRERIAKRMQQQTGRECESVIELEYLQKLQKHENNVVKALERQGVKVLTLDWDKDRDSPGLRKDMIYAISDYILNYESKSDIFSLDDVKPVNDYWLHL